MDSGERAAGKPPWLRLALPSCYTVSYTAVPGSFGLCVPKTCSH